MLAGNARDTERVWRDIAQSYLNKRAVTSSAAVTGDGDLVSDVAAGRRQLGSIGDDELPDDLRALPAERRAQEHDRHMMQRKAMNEKLVVLVTKRDRFVAEQRIKSPAKASTASSRKRSRRKSSADALRARGCRRIGFGQQAAGRPAAAVIVLLTLFLKRSPAFGDLGQRHLLSRRDGLI